MTVINITTYLDTACAWCFIGHRTVNQAIQLYQRTYPGGKDDSFLFTFLPYYLNAAAPVDGIPMDQGIAIKYGADGVEGMKARVRRTGQAHGIAFDLSGRTGNTRLSHTLLYCAEREKGSEVQKALLEAIFNMHFEQGGDITSAEDLVKAAETAGVDGTDARRWLDDAESAGVVDGLAAKTKAEDGVTSVPTFVVNGQQRLEGAEDAGAFYEAFVAAKGEP